MSFLGNIVHDAENVGKGLVGGAKQGVTDIGNWAGNVASAVNPFSPQGPTGGPFGADTYISAGKQQSSGPQSNLYNSLLDEVTKNLTYGQEQGPGATGLANSIYSQLSGLSPKEAATILGDIPTGTTLATDIGNLSNPPNSAANQSALNFGFDPLSLGQMFSQTLAPWLAGQEKQSDAGIANYSSQMADALKGASPQLQAAYKVAVPAMQEAESQQNQAVKSATGTAPEWDALIAGITNATQAAKLAQGAAAAEPYWAATTGTGTVPTSAPYQQAQTYLTQLLAGAR